MVKFGKIEDDKEHEKEHVEPEKEPIKQTADEQIKSDIEEQKDIKPEWTPPPSFNAEPMPQELDKPSSFADALTYGADLIHHELGVYVWSGFELDEKELQIWNSLMKSIVPFIDIKYLPLLTAAFLVVITEVFKVSGYLKARKQAREANPA